MANVEFQKYQTDAAYEAAAKPTTDSRISEIESNGVMAVDGVNIITTEPEDGDALFLEPVEEGGTTVKKKRFLKGGDALNVSLIPNTWEKVGAVIGRYGRKALVIDKTDTSLQWLACWQYAITAISSTSIVIKLRMVSDYSAYTEVPVELTAAEVNATSASEISAALAAKCTELGISLVFWAYYDEANSRIIVQCDSNPSYQLYNVAGTGCTIALVVWEDMPATSTNGFRNDGGNGGILNVTRGATYYGTHGSSISADVPLMDTSTIVGKTDFEQSSYCKQLRDTYGTYENYISIEKTVRVQNKKGVFSLPSAKELTEKYGNSKFTKKDGTDAYKFPALHQGAAVGYDCDGLRVGDWYIPGVNEIIAIMRDDAVAVDSNMVKRTYNNTLKKMSGSQVANNAGRWCAQRVNAYHAWLFGGSGGYLHHLDVYLSFHCQAVTLCDVD